MTKKRTKKRRQVDDLPTRVLKMLIKAGLNEEQSARLFEKRALRDPAMMKIISREIGERFFSLLEKAGRAQPLTEEEEAFVETFRPVLEAMIEGKE